MDKPIPQGIGAFHIAGNKHADELATLAACDVELPMDIVQPIVYHTHLVQSIQLRLAYIIMNLPGRIGVQLDRIPRPKPTPIQDYFDASEHCPFFVDARVACLRCRSSVSARDTRLVKEWLSEPCIAIGSFLEKPMPVPYGTRVGRSKIDPTHNPYIYKRAYLLPYLLCPFRNRTCHQRPS